MEIELLIILITLFVGSLIQTTIGFGAGIIATPILYMVSPETVPFFVSFVFMILCICILYINRFHFVLGELIFAVIFRIPGTIVGAWLLMIISQQILALIIGISVLMAVVISIFNISIGVNRGSMAIAGFFSGIMGTIAAIGGPPIVLLMQNEDAGKLKAGLAFFFTISSIMSLIAQWWVGKVPTIPTGWWLLSILAVILGFLSGRWFSARFRSEWLRPVILSLCGISGLSVITQVF